MTDNAQQPAEPTDAQMLDWVLRTNARVFPYGNKYFVTEFLPPKDGPWEPRPYLIGPAAETKTAAIAAAMKEHP